MQKVKELKEIQTAIDKNPDDITLRTQYLFVMRDVQNEVKTSSRDRKQLQNAIDFAKDVELRIDEASLVEKADYEYLVYRPMFRLMLSGTYGFKDPIRATKELQKGVLRFDELVAKYPDNEIIRGYRAINYSNLPSLFEKEESVLSDVDYILSLKDHVILDPMMVFILEAGVLVAEKLKVDSTPYSSRLSTIQRKEG